LESPSCPTLLIMIRLYVHFPVHVATSMRAYPRFDLIVVFRHSKTSSMSYTIETFMLSFFSIIFMFRPSPNMASTLLHPQSPQLPSHLALLQPSFQKGSPTRCPWHLCHPSVSLTQTPAPIHTTGSHHHGLVRILPCTIIALPCLSLNRQKICSHSMSA
jgi:hypothetical protein